MTKADVQEYPQPDTALAVPAQDLGAVLQRGWSISSWIVKMSNTRTGLVVCILGGLQDQTEESPDYPGLISEADSARSRRLE